MNQREQFESWHRNTYLCANKQTLEADWETWQAAQAAQQPEIEALRARVAELEKDLGTYKYAFFGLDAES